MNSPKTRFTLKAQYGGRTRKAWLAFAVALMIASAATTPAGPPGYRSERQPAHQSREVALPAGVTRVVSIEGITQYNLTSGLKVLLIRSGQAHDNGKHNLPGWLAR